LGTVPFPCLPRRKVSRRKLKAVEGCPISVKRGDILRGDS